MFARAFSVFNVDQVDGYEPEPIAVLPDAERLAHAETFITNLGIKTVFGGSKAYYQPSTDAVYMPPFENFRDAAAFYGVWLHETGHGSGAKHRLDRDLTGRFGSAAYAFEEISVEILSGLVLADLGIAHHPRPDHAAYIASWLDVLKNDPRAIFTAASKAQAAADWMHAQQPDAPVPRCAMRQPSHRRADQARQSLAHRAPGRAFTVGVGTSPEGRQSERRVTTAPSITAFTYDELDGILRGAGGHDVITARSACSTEPARP
jgi:antirestriction protein ArdC